MWANAGGRSGPDRVVGATGLTGRLLSRHSAKTMPCKLAIMVCCAPEETAGAHSALKFTAAAVARGCAIVRVFFYHQGVMTGLAGAQPPGGEFDLRSAWRELATAHDLDLVLCVGAAQRRGVLDLALAAESDRAPTLSDGFRIAGLGAWFDAVLEADRVIRFDG